MKIEIIWFRDGISGDGKTKIYEDGQLKNTDGKWVNIQIVEEN